MTPTLQRPAIRTSQPRRRSQSVTAPSKVVRRRTRQKSDSLVIASQSLFVAAVAWGAVFVTSSLVGNATLEKIRVERIRSQERAHQARTEISRLRVELDAAQSVESVDRWARAEGMVLSGAGLNPATDRSRYVAKAD